ncbi:hypothetical protein CFOL_v3_34406 [Cephalotus follicularis]|uniref:Uncharacterized protein n=1 Tax=Cephalotus follicularis TaxID=3775 RepID=A0A1Q3DEP4_CEPFO|nr:hypothetical protein CFOL_v3_34406 [Cephalotus follicularis]
MNDKGALNVAPEDAQNPCFWSRVCLHNMSKLAKEPTTIPRVLESLFRYFDNGFSWSPEQVSDVMRHLRKSIHCSLDDANLGDDVIKWNRNFREAVDKCLVQLSYKILDADNGRRLESLTSRLATRDIVQFVPMREVHVCQKRTCCGFIFAKSVSDLPAPFSPVFSFSDILKSSMRRVSTASVTTCK